MKRSSGSPAFVTSRRRDMLTTDVSDAAIPVSEEILRWSGICYLQEAGHVNIVTTDVVASCLSLHPTNAQL
jgi:hypothetical protein